MKTGQVVGASDRIAGEAISRPVTFGEVYATLFHHLGIAPSQTTLRDRTAVRSTSLKTTPSRFRNWFSGKPLARAGRVLVIATILAAGIGFKSISCSGS
jgi:hypothetical protein